MRIPLRVAAQADAFLQVVEREQVVLPRLIDDAQHDVALEQAHQVGAEPGLLVGVARFDHALQMLAELLRVELVELDVAAVHLEVEEGEHVGG